MRVLSYLSTIQTRAAIVCSVWRNGEWLPVHSAVHMTINNSHPHKLWLKRRVLRPPSIEAPDTGHRMLDTEWVPNTQRRAQVSIMRHSQCTPKVVRWTQMRRTKTGFRADRRQGGDHWSLSAEQIVVWITARAVIVICSEAFRFLAFWRYLYGGIH